MYLITLYLQCYIKYKLWVSLLLEKPSQNQKWPIQLWSPLNHRPNWYTNLCCKKKTSLEEWTFCYREEKTSDFILVWFWFRSEFWFQKLKKKGNIFVALSDKSTKRPKHTLKICLMLTRNIGRCRLEIKYLECINAFESLSLSTVFKKHLCLCDNLKKHCK